MFFNMQIPSSLVCQAPWKHPAHILRFHASVAPRTEPIADDDQDTREDQVPPSATIDSHDIYYYLRLYLHHPYLQLPLFPTTLASLSSQISLTGTFPCPSSSLLVYALAKQWKTRSIILTTATSAASQTVTHLHLSKSDIPSSLELHRLPITQDTAIYVTEQSEPSMNSTQTSTLSKCESRSGARGSEGKSSGLVVAIEQGHIIWHFEMQDPSDRQKWISHAIKAIVLSQRSILPACAVHGVHRFDHHGAGNFVPKFAPPTRAITASYAPHKPIMGGMQTSMTMPTSSAAVNDYSSMGDSGCTSSAVTGTPDATLTTMNTYFTPAYGRGSYEGGGGGSVCAASYGAPTMATTWSAPSATTTATF
ncbi:hypothetical protein EDD22DRAFT_849308 [Suillus occidentalis]|nr:hypothetical protein EDD22DRAFT_849308 [Suillus occidentalis]